MPFPFTFPFQFGGALPPFTEFTSPVAGAGQLAVSDALGVDIRCLNDLDPYFSLAVGPDCLAQDIVHRWSTSAGQLIYDLDYGRDVRQMLNAGITGQTLTLLQKNLEAEAEKDQRVQSCVVTAIFDPQSETIMIFALLGTVVGTYQLVTAISNDVVSLVSMALVS